MNKMPIFVTKPLKNVFAYVSLLSFVLVSGVAMASGAKPSSCETVLSGLHLEIFNDKDLMTSAKNVLSKLRSLKGTDFEDATDSVLNPEDKIDVDFYITELKHTVHAGSTYQKAYAIPYALILRNISGLALKVNEIFKKNKLNLVNPGSWGAITKARRINKTVEEIVNEPSAEISVEARQIYDAVVKVRRYVGNVDTQSFESFIKDLVSEVSKENKANVLFTVSETTGIFNPTNGLWVSLAVRDLVHLGDVLKIPSRKIDEFGVLTLLYYSELLSQDESNYVQSLIKEASDFYKQNRDRQFP